MPVAVRLCVALTLPCVGAWTPALASPLTTVAPRIITQRQSLDAATPPLEHTGSRQRGSVPCMAAGPVAARIAALATLRGGAIAGLRPLLTVGSVVFAAALLALARGLSRASALLKTPIEEGPFPSRWEALRRQLNVAKRPAPVAAGAAAAHSRGARQEAVCKIISNHKMVLRDLTDPLPVTQLDLERLPSNPSGTAFADELLYELARRLLGTAQWVDKLEVIEPSSSKQTEMWSCAARLFSGRIQSTANECPGRRRDMSPAAAAAVRAVLDELAEVGAPAPVAMSA